MRLLLTLCLLFMIVACRSLQENAATESPSTSISISQNSAAANDPFLGLEDFTGPAHRIAFLGGTMIAHMDHHGWIETAMTTRWPQYDLAFRNLGWPADDVFGTARSEFGSAHNTKSWKPPTPEEGYGFEVLKEHIALANPDILFLAYGAEAAFTETEEAYQAFQNGYIQLLDELESKSVPLILMSPHQHWAVEKGLTDPSKQNEKLMRASAMIDSLAQARDHLFIDLFSQLTPISDPISSNGIHLNEQGYLRLLDVVMKQLKIKGQIYDVSFNGAGELQQAKHGTVSDIVATNRGFRFTLKPDHLHLGGYIGYPEEHLLKIDGKIRRERSESALVISASDSLRIAEIRQHIILKNDYHRHRINPLNKVYTLLFRQHEMGHLAYELEDYERLVEEQDDLISRMKQPIARRVVIERLDPWKSPRDYPDHEVPTEVPSPNVEEELAAFTISEGFELNLFASDPMIANPINITWDRQGRAWVATSTTYPQIKPGRKAVDQIVILEDTDKDGKADKKTVFADGLLIPHSVMPVEGGAYVATTTEFLFMADYDGDDVADETRVIYSGFGRGDVHHTIHCMRWAPWGDLYFSQSININSFVETPYGPRTLNGSGFWQFRPETEALDIFAIGMINPWGQAFDEWGQVFATDGAGGEGPSYLFPGSAHRTAVGSDRILDGLLTGKPKNTSAEFVSSQHLPEHWQGSLLANDFRANRTIRYEITPDGSGYAAEEIETILHSSHRSYRPVDIKLGPDGAAYIVDWYSPIIDHGEVDFYHPSRDKSHGRIWRLTAKDRPLDQAPHIADASIDALLDLLKQPDQYSRMQANRELIRRNCSPQTLKAWTSNLSPTDSRYEQNRLEAMWLGVALNQPDQALLTDILTSPDYRARAAAVRMIPRIMNGEAAMNALAQSVQDSHPQVRLEAVNALRILAQPGAVSLALEALDLPIDADLDYALWLIVKELEEQWLPDLLAGESIFNGNVDRLAFALTASNSTEATRSLANLVKQGKVSGEEKQQILLMIASLGEADELDMVLEIASQGPDKALLRALADAPASNVAVPEKTEPLIALLKEEDSEIRSLAARLAGRWKLSSSTTLLIQQAQKASVTSEERLAAATALIQVGEIEFVKSIAKGGKDMSIRASAAAAWAKTEPKAAAPHAATILGQSRSIEDAALLFQRFCGISDGPEVLEASLQGQRLDSAVAVKGIRIAQSSGQNLSQLVQTLSKAADLKRVGISLSASQRQQLLADVAKGGDISQGKQIYLRPSLVCTTCHEVDGEGGKLGPDLSTLGAYMTSASILESLLSPGTDIKQGYETVMITKTNGAVVSGTLDRKTETAALIRTAGGIVSVSNEEIQDLKVNMVSLMPPGLTASLRYDELVDLMTYLNNLGR